MERFKEIADCRRTFGPFWFGVDEMKGTWGLPKLAKCILYRILSFDNESLDHKSLRARITLLYSTRHGILY